MVTGRRLKSKANQQAACEPCVYLTILWTLFSLPSYCPSAKSRYILSVDRMAFPWWKVMASEWVDGFNTHYILNLKRWRMTWRRCSPSTGRPGCAHGRPAESWLPMTNGRMMWTLGNCLAESGWTASRESPTWQWGRHDSVISRRHGPDRLNTTADRYG